MTLDDFKEQLLRHDGLIQGMGIMINKWLVPPKPAKENGILEKFSSKLPTRYFSKDYWTNNKAFLVFLFFILSINLILFIHRAYYFRNFSMLSGFTPNPFYLLSRANGKTLLFNSILVLLLVLRNTITLLRKFGLGSILPLDNNIYLHKLVGVMIFIQALIHTIMHLCNFAINVQPDPVKFVTQPSQDGQAWSQESNPSLPFLFHHALYHVLYLLYLGLFLLCPYHQILLGNLHDHHQRLEHCPPLFSCRSESSNISLVSPPLPRPLPPLP